MGCLSEIRSGLGFDSKINPSDSPYLDLLSDTYTLSLGVAKEVNIKRVTRIT